MKLSGAMKGFLVFVVILVVSVILTGPFYRVLNPLFKFKYEQILNRLLEVLIIAAIILSMRGKKIGWQEYGVAWACPWKKLISYGFLAGAGTVLFVIAFGTVFGPRYLRHPLMLQDIVERFVKGMVSGSAVAVAEEFVFRGFLFVSLERKIKTFWALVITSAIYSGVHFLDNGQVFVPSNPNLGDSVRLLLGYFEPFVGRPEKVLPEFIGLFLLGLVLSSAFIRTRTLFLSIGIHAGAVFMIKFSPSFVRKGPDDYRQWLGGNAVYDGIFEWLVLIFLIWVVYVGAARIGRDRS